MDVLLGLVAGVAVLWLLLLAVLWVIRPKGVGLGEAVRLVPDVLRLCRDLLVDPSTPRPVRLALLGLIAWLVSPVDLIPEFIPVLGPLDDAIVAVLVLRFAHRRLGDARFRAAWRGTAAGYELLGRFIGTALPA